LINKALLDFETAIRYTDRKETLENAKAHFMRAKALQESYKLKEAIDDYNRYINICQKLSEKFCPEAYIGIGDCLFHQQEYEKSCVVST